MFSKRKKKGKYTSKHMSLYCIYCISNGAINTTMAGMVKLLLLVVHFVNLVCSYKDGYNTQSHQKFKSLLLIQYVVSCQTSWKKEMQGKDACTYSNQPKYHFT